MNRTSLTTAATLAIVAGATCSVDAAVVALYDFENNSSGNGGNEFDDSDTALYSVDTDTDSVATRLASDVIDGGGGNAIIGTQFGATGSASGSPNSNFGNADEAGAYFSFTVTPNAGKQISYESLSFYYGTHSNGSGEYGLRYVDGANAEVTVVSTGSDPRFAGVNLYTINLGGFTSSDTVEWRIYLSSSSDTVGQRFDDITLNATVSDIPEPGSLALLGLGGLCLIRRRR